MLSLISSAVGFLASGLPQVLSFFQDRADKAQELKLAQMQTERELALAERGFLAQQKVEEIRTDQIALQTDAERQGAALEHDKAIMARASSWVVNLNGIVRPAVTFIFVFRLHPVLQSQTIVDMLVHIGLPRRLVVLHIQCGP